MHGVDADDEATETYYLGSNEVLEPVEGTRRISVPEAARRALGLSPGDRVRWAYEDTVGFLILATDTLSEVDDYTNVGGPTTLGGEDDAHRVTVPVAFFRGEDAALRKQGTPPEARVGVGERRHFVARDRFLTDESDPDPTVCYLLTRQQVGTRLGGDGDAEWNDAYESRPRFLR
jgi:bifunctional DNA-binding transcriptional regulator/antitoxin component of YhaV-PrlF toxin-antitoxin module